MDRARYLLAAWLSRVQVAIFFASILVAFSSPRNWRFTTADARIKLKHLYPAIEP
jgi:hypothetical protein